MRKSVVRVSDQVLHKPGSKTTGDGYRLVILDLRRKEIYYRCRETKVLIVVAAKLICVFVFA